MRNVSKAVFLDSLTCPTLGWLARRDSGKPLSTSDQFRMEEGIEVGKLARLLYPKGILVQAKDLASAAQTTACLMRDKNASCLFEATFTCGDSIAKADILKRENRRWHLYEVKASLNDRDEFRDDMAYTTMVALKAGCNIGRISLLLLSRDYRMGMSIKSLFVEIDHTQDVLSRAKELSLVWDEVVKATARPRKPPARLTWQCKPCELFGECVGKGIKNPIFDLNGLRQQKFARLQSSDVTRIEDIPSEFDLNDIQSRIRDCVKTGKLFVARGMKKALKQVKWPVYYLDFETVGTALPLYRDVAPHEHIPTQYSIHKCSRAGRPPDHFEYLADPSRDCRQDLAIQLIKDLGKRGSILTYTSFEMTIMQQLADRLPSLERPLRALIGRCVDLKKIIQDNVYHPRFHGSFSIKDVLPALLKDRCYDSLKIANGSSAMSAFASLARGKYGKAESETLKQDLLDYCEQDTFSMVKLHQKLREYT